MYMQCLPGVDNKLDIFFDTLGFKTPFLSERVKQNTLLKIFRIIIKMVLDNHAQGYPLFISKIKKKLVHQLI